MSARSYCFTSFEKELKINTNECRYAIIGREICPTTGKEHIQGYAEFPKKITWKTAQKILGDPNMHIELRRGTRDQAREYCMKEGVYEELGDWNAGGQGARTDLITLTNKLRAGYTDAQLLKENPEDIYRYQKFIKRVRDILTEEASENYLKSFAENFVPNAFQTEMIQKIEEQKEREVLWIYDEKGGAGKTLLSKYLIAEKKALRFTNGKTADIAYAMKPTPLVVFDFSRSLAECVNYDVIEQIKNGMVFSGKYESCCKMFAPPKVVIMANFYPNTTKLSNDRWVIHTV